MKLFCKRIYLLLGPRVIEYCITLDIYLFFSVRYGKDYSKYGICKKKRVALPEKFSA